MSLREIEDIKPKDIEVLTKSYNKRRADEMFMISYCAWQNRAVNASDKNGKYLVREFKDLFDYDEMLGKTKKKNNVNKQALKRIAILNNG